MTSCKCTLLLLICYLFLNNKLLLSNVRASHISTISQNLQSQNGRKSELAPKLKTSNGSRGGTMSANSYDVPPVTGGEVIATRSYPINAQEPSCEQLRAMWIFSKRQSRAAEITNEIPTYRDPFTFNIWEPYYSSTRNIAAVRMLPNFGDRNRSPVFGKVISREPLYPARINLEQRKPYFNGEGGINPRPYGTETKANIVNLRKSPQQNRYIAGPNGLGSIPNSGTNSDIGAVQGSFQKLKELIWTERAKELSQQRRAEELAAKAAVLKEIANGQNLHSVARQNVFISDSPLMDMNRSPDSDGFQYMNDNAASQTESSQITPTPKSRFHKSSARLNYGRINSDKNLKTQNIKESMDEESLGLSKMYPLRPSHFRERNKALFKPKLPTEYYHRYARIGPQVYLKTIEDIGDLPNTPYDLIEENLNFDPSKKVLNYFSFYKDDKNNLHSPLIEN